MYCRHKFYVLLMSGGQVYSTVHERMKPIDLPGNEQVKKRYILSIWSMSRKGDGAKHWYIVLK